MRILTAGLLALGLAAPFAAPTFAQDQTTEDKLREALRRSTVDLRALQDSQAQLQADRDSAMKQRDALQQQVTDLQAKLAAQPGAAAGAAAGAKPGEPAAPDQMAQLQNELQQAQAAIDAARRDNAALSASNAKWQAAYQQAASIAQQRDAAAKQASTALATTQKAREADYQANVKLAALAKDILHLYRTTSFRRLLIGSFEPLLGLKEVELENLVQDYEDKIYDLRIFREKTPAGTDTGATAAGTAP